MWDLPSVPALKTGKGRHVNNVSSESAPSLTSSITGPHVQLCAVSVLMEHAQHQTSAPVTLDGQEGTAALVRENFCCYTSRCDIPKPPAICSVACENGGHCTMPDVCTCPEDEWIGQTCTEGSKS